MPFGTVLGGRLRLEVGACAGDLLVRIGHADRAVGREMRGDRAVVEVGRGEEAVTGHHRLRHDRARVDQMRDVPFVRIFAADAGEVRPGALRSPLERMVVHALGGERVVAVALDLVAQRADHLRVAGVAALADVDVAAGELERRVGPHAPGLLDGAVEIEQRGDLDQAADRDDDQHADHQQDRVLLERLLQRHDRAPHSAGASAGWRALAGTSPAIVFQTFHAISSAPARKSAPPTARMT